jgi:hypothetical protein
MQANITQKISHATMTAEGFETVGLVFGRSKNSIYHAATEVVLLTSVTNILKSFRKFVLL